MTMIDEGPSSEDLERFGDDTALCPDCGAEVWDEADICPKCFAYIGGQASRHAPLQRWVNRKSIILIVILLLIGFGLMWILSAPTGR